MLGSPRRKRFLTGLLIATSVGVVSCLAFGLNLLSTAQLRSSDFLFGAANAIKNEEQDGKVVIFAIDDESLDQLGRFSLWPRTHYARLIDTLGEANVVEEEMYWSFLRCLYH